MGISLRFFRKRKTQPKDYHETYSFLSEDEKVIEKAITKTGKWIWKVVGHGWKLSDKETEFRWDELASNRWDSK